MVNTTYKNYIFDYLGVLTEPKFVQEVQSLSVEGKRLFVLSNSSVGHIHADLSRAGILNCFESIYAYDNSKYHKPDPRSFQEVIDVHQLVPSETLFIDDNQRNCEVARHLDLAVMNV